MSGFDRKYTARHETRTVRDGANAVHLGEPGGLQPVGKRRPSADAARAARRRAGARRRCSTSRWSTRSPTAPSSCAQAIAALYPGATIDHIEVTNGGSEANYITTWQPGRARRRGGDAACRTTCRPGAWRAPSAATVREWPLVEDRAAGRWRVDLAALDALVTPRTKLIVICNPNNPTGARLTAAELDGIARVADRVGAWMLSDEIYRGAELDGVETPSMWGRGERVIVTSGLSKAYGLPGLRIGWIVGPPALVASLWSYHDYMTIAPGALSDRLARVALAPERRARCSSARAASCARNLPLLEAWLRDARRRFRWMPPEAGAIVYVRYDHPINSTTLVTRLREEKSVLVVPGDHFGMDGYLRLGFGEPPDYVTARPRRGCTSCSRRWPRPAHRAVRRMNAARAVARPGRVRQRRAALRPAARRGRRPPRLRVAGRRHRDAPSRQRRRSRRRRHAPRARRRSRPGQSLDRARPGAARAQRHRRDPPGRATLLADEAAEGRLVCIETTVLDIDRGEPAVVARARRARRRRRTSSPPTRGRRRSPTTSSRRWPSPSIACSSSRAR